MVLTGVLTAGVAFSVDVYVLCTGSTWAVRAPAFAVLVFAEFLRSFGARSETKPVWRIPFFTNANLVAVVALTLGMQVWSQHNATLERILHIAYLPFFDCLGLLLLGAIPLAVLEVAKLVPHSGRARTGKYG